MKSIIVYYSATGNTTKIARSIHRGMRSLLEECDSARLREVDSQDLVKYDLIGLGSPIWAGREPANVWIYIHGMPQLDGKLCFPFCTHGAWPIGFMYWVVPELLRKGLTVIGWNDWYGGSHQLPYILQVHPCDGHPDEIDVKEAEDFGREMAERGQRILSGETNLIPELPKGPDVDLLWQCRPPERRPYGEAKRIARREIKINMEKCLYPECTLCMDVCPMDSIDFSVTPPAFRRNCLMCFTCEGICPAGAIEIDWQRIFGVTGQRRTSGAEHPFSKYLREAEDKGRFRRLVPVEKAYSDTPMWKLRQHPRYVIEED